MTTTKKAWLFTTVSGALMIALGAFGGHLMARTLTETNYAIYQVAHNYHVIQTLALIGYLLYQQQTQSKNNKTSLLFCLGIVLFSGSLYIYSVTSLSWLMFITPVGGLSLILGWLFWAWDIAKN